MSNSRQSGKNSKAKVQALYTRLAGDKLDKCNELAEKLVAQGYKQERAWAEALDVFKLVKNEEAA